MSISTWQKYSRPGRSRLGAELLEARTVPASLLVTTTADTLNSPPSDAVSLRDAILYTNAHATEQNSITLPAGTYTLSRAGANEDSGQTGDLDVINSGAGSLAIFGAGADKTIIDAAEIDRVFEVRPGAKLQIVGATIRNGSADSGGAFLDSGQLEIDNCMVENNTATSVGGAVEVVGGAATLTSQTSSFVNNFAGVLGGAIKNIYGSIQINSGLFRNNQTGTLGAGGAVHTLDGLFIAITCTFDQNLSGMGGAISTDSGNFSVADSTFTGNQAVYSGASAKPSGGAIDAEGTMSIERSTFTGNLAGKGGRGGAIANYGSMEVEDSTISGNQAGATGGFGAGAGIYNSGGMRLVNSTVVKNTVLGGGFAGGVDNVAPAGSFNIQNTIVALNLPVPANNDPDFQSNTSITSGGGNLIGINTQTVSVGWTAADQLGSFAAPIDPKIGPLQDNGGPSQTYALLPGSPAIDRGTDGGILADTGGVDQRSLPRVVNSTPDIGAYEVQFIIANDQSLTTNEDTTLTGQATVADGGTLAFAVQSQPAHGALTAFDPATGNFTYAPSANFNGTDSFTFEANDGTAESNVATVTITVHPVNDVPNFSAGAGQTVVENAGPQTVAGWATGISAGPSDESSQALNFLISTDNDGLFAALPSIDSATGNLTYTPAADVTGTATVAVNLHDDGGTADGGIDTSGVQTFVISVNDLPLVPHINGPTSVAEGSTYTLALSADDPDQDAIAQWVVNWGDGNTETVDGAANSATHVYAEGPNSYTLSASATDDDGTFDADGTLSVMVNNAPPSSASIAGPSRGVRGQSRTFTLIATDPSPADQAADFTFFINWGDGGSTMTTGPSGTTVQHTFTASGNFSPVLASVSDKDGGTLANAGSTSIGIEAAEVQGNDLIVGGTTGNDTILFAPTDRAGSFEATINGASQGIFNIAGEIVVYAQAGDDTVRLSTTKIRHATVSIADPVLFLGGDGNDVLDASRGTGSALLVGGAGSDSLLGGSGRNILIGGLGADTVRGGGNDDIIIGGYTDFDDDLAALDALMSEWSRTDASYSSRVGHLNGTIVGGSNGNVDITVNTVHDDHTVDQLYGGSGSDWFLAATTGAEPDRIHDSKRGEIITPL